MLSPKRTKFRKMMKGKNRGIAWRGSDVSFGDFALQAGSGGGDREEPLVAVPGGGDPLPPGGPDRDPAGARLAFVDPPARDQPAVPDPNPWRQEGTCGVQPSSAFALAFDAPRRSVMNATP